MTGADGVVDGACNFLQHTPKVGLFPESQGFLCCLEAWVVTPHKERLGTDPI